MKINKLFLLLIITFFQKTFSQIISVNLLTKNEGSLKILVLGDEHIGYDPKQEGNITQCESLKDFFNKSDKIKYIFESRDQDIKITKENIKLNFVLPNSSLIHKIQYFLAVNPDFPSLQFKNILFDPADVRQKNIFEVTYLHENLDQLSKQLQKATKSINDAKTTFLNKDATKKQCVDAHHNVLAMYIEYNKGVLNFVSKTKSYIEKNIETCETLSKRVINLFNQNLAADNITKIILNSLIKKFAQTIESIEKLNNELLINALRRNSLLLSISDNIDADNAAEALVKLSNEAICEFNIFAKNLQELIRGFTEQYFIADLGFIISILETIKSNIYDKIILHVGEIHAKHIVRFFLSLHYTKKQYYPDESITTLIGTSNKLITGKELDKILNEIFLSQQERKSSALLSESTLSAASTSASASNTINIGAFRSINSNIPTINLNSDRQTVYYCPEYQEIYDNHWDA